MEHEQGICPKCRSDGLTYGDTKKQDIAFGFLYVCESCGFEGIEWYNLHFTEHTDPGCNKVETEEIPKAPEQKTDTAMQKKQHIIIIMQEGCIQTVKSTHFNTEVSIAIEPDEFTDDDDPTEYNRLIDLAGTDEYLQIY